MARQTNDECRWCGQTIELAEDGAWQTIDSGACGCSESLEQGGDGEHEVFDAEAAAEARYFDQWSRIDEIRFGDTDGWGA